MFQTTNQIKMVNEIILLKAELPQQPHLPADPFGLTSLLGVTKVDLRQRRCRSLSLIQT